MHRGAHLVPTSASRVPESAHSVMNRAGVDSESPAADALGAVGAVPLVGSQTPTTSATLNSTGVHSQQHEQSQRAEPQPGHSCHPLLLGSQRYDWLTAKAVAPLGGASGLGRASRRDTASISAAQKDVLRADQGSIAGSIPSQTYQPPPDRLLGRKEIRESA